jgi:DNA gyrase subunit A
MMFSDAGKVIRFKEKHVRTMSRIARGVRGMRLADGQRLISMLIPESGAQILSASERGYGKRTPLEDYPRRGRGGQGVIAMVINDRNGKLVGAVLLGSTDEVLLISDGGTLVRTRGSEISRVGRNTQGVTLIRLSKGEKLQAVERLDGSLAEEAEVIGEAVAGDATEQPAAP